MKSAETAFKKQLRVLLVDDVQVHHDLLETGIEIFNPFIKIDHASTLEEAITKLYQHAYSAVVVDWDTCDGVGEALVKWMRARANFMRVACIVVSAQVHNDCIAQALMDREIDACVVKPFKRLELFEKMMLAVRKRQGGTAQDSRPPTGESR